MGIQDGLGVTRHSFYNAEGGFVIHLNNGCCYIFEHHMDYKRSGLDGVDLVSANFMNSVVKRGQVVDQHPRYPKPHGYTSREIQKLYQTQNCIVGSLIDDLRRYRICIEVVKFIEVDMEGLTEYDLNAFSNQWYEDFDPTKMLQGFSSWNDKAKAK